MTLSVLVQYVQCYRYNVSLRYCLIEKAEIMHINNNLFISRSILYFSNVGKVIRSKEIKRRKHINRINR